MSKHISVKDAGKKITDPGSSPGTRGGPLSGKRTPRMAVKDSPTPSGPQKR